MERDNIAKNHRFIQRKQIVTDQSIEGFNKTTNKSTTLWEGLEWTNIASSYKRNQAVNSPPHPTGHSISFDTKGTFIVLKLFDFSV